MNPKHQSTLGVMLLFMGSIACAQVARNLVTQFVVYATGGEIQFADRDEIEKIVQKTRKDDYRVRTIIYEIVKSRMFRNK